MRIFKYLLAFLLFCSPVMAEQITMPQYSPTGTLTSVNLNSRFNTLTNLLNGSLDNTNASTTDGFRFHEILGALPANGTQGRVVFLTSNNTLNFDTGTAWKVTAILSNDQTFTGTNTFTDLIATTADINDGTLDGVQIAGATTTGTIFYNDDSDDVSSLVPGAQNFFLKSNGTSDIPSYASLPTGKQEFLANGNFTAPEGVRVCWVTIMAGGGGGGGSSGSVDGGGGGGGQTILKRRVTLDAEEVVPIVIGAGGTGGAGGVPGDDGTDGADSTFTANSETITALKGAKGLGGGNSGLGGAGGGSGSDRDASGATGGFKAGAGGDGGDTAGSNGGGGGATFSYDGSDGDTSSGEDEPANKGIGGTGSGTASGDGGNGSSGFGLVEW